MGDTTTDHRSQSRSQLTPIKSDITEICKNIKQCHDCKSFVLENVVIFHENMLCVLTCNGFIFLIN